MQQIACSAVLQRDSDMMRAIYRYLKSDCPQPTSPRLGKNEAGVLKKHPPRELCAPGYTEGRRGGEAASRVHGAGGHQLADNCSHSTKQRERQWPKSPCGSESRTSVVPLWRPASNPFVAHTPRSENQLGEDRRGALFTGRTDAGEPK